MVGSLFDFIIFLVGACLVAALILWCVKRFFPDVYAPARYIVGAVVLIALLLKLKPFILAALS